MNNPIWPAYLEAWPQRVVCHCCGNTGQVSRQPQTEIHILSTSSLWVTRQEPAWHNQHDSIIMALSSQHIPRYLVIITRSSCNHRPLSRLSSLRQKKALLVSVHFLQSARCAVSLGPHAHTRPTAIIMAWVPCIGVLDHQVGCYCPRNYGEHAVAGRLPKEAHI